MKSSQEIQKEIDYVMNFAEQMGVPDEIYFQFIAVADSYLRDGPYERAEQQVSQALLAAQSYNLKPAAGIMENTMKLSKRQLKRIIREEKQKIQELDFSGPARGDDALIQLEEAVRRCYSKGMSMDEVLDAAEQAYLNSAM